MADWWNTFLQILGLKPTPIVSSLSETTPTPTPTSTPTPTPTPSNPYIPTQLKGPVTEDVIRGGLESYGKLNAPLLATESGQFATTANQYLAPTKADPLTGVVLALMEQGKGMNNPWNVFTPGTTQPHPYPSFPQGIEKATSGVGGRWSNPGYKRYAETGSLADLFSGFTPYGPEHPENPSLDELTKRYMFFRKMFEDQYGQ